MYTDEQSTDGWMDVYPGNADDESMREEDLSFSRVSRSSSSSLCCKDFFFCSYDRQRETKKKEERRRRRKKTMMRFLYSSSR